MAFPQPILPFLRPLGPPRPRTVRHLLRFSTATRFRVDASTIPIPSATSPAPASSPSTSSPAASSPIHPQSPSRAADIAAAEAATDADNATSPTPSSPPPLPSKRSPTSNRAPRPKQTPPPPASQEPETLTYHVARTPSKQLPVYKDAKRGGNLHQTLIRKITGDAAALREDMRRVLRLKEGDVKVNPVTGHVVIKGWHKDTIVKYLESKNF